MKRTDAWDFILPGTEIVYVCPILTKIGLASIMLYSPFSVISLHTEIQNALFVWKISKNKIIRAFFLISCFYGKVSGPQTFCYLFAISCLLISNEKSVFNVRDREFWRRALLGAENAISWSLTKLWGDSKAWGNLAAILGTWKLSNLHSFLHFQGIYKSSRLFSQGYVFLSLSEYFLHFAAIMACPLSLFSEK